jgi:hypothetical protein
LKVSVRAIPGPEEPQLKASAMKTSALALPPEARLYPVPAKPPHYDVGEGEPELILEIDLTLFDDALADAREL